MPHHRRASLAKAFAAVCASAIVAGCAGSRPSTFQREEFQSSSTYSRSFHASSAQTCEAARRSLLSQGYVVILANGELVNARKSFQPESDSHVELEFRVVCAAEGRHTGNTLAFVTALQDRYALKKSNNSASVGVGAIGSLSLPFIGSDDSLVKVASETISAPAFYDRYFRLLTEYLGNSEPEPVVTPASAPPAAEANPPVGASARSATPAIPTPAIPATVTPSMARPAAEASGHTPAAAVAPTATSVAPPASAAASAAPAAEGSASSAAAAASAAPAASAASAASPASASSAASAASAASAGFATPPASAPVAAPVAATSPASAASTTPAASAAETGAQR